MKPIVIFKVGNTFSRLARRFEDFDAWVKSGIGPTAMPVEVIDPRPGAALPSPDAIAGAIITGSQAMVTDREPWSEALAAWLREAVPQRLPVLGICYGHQLLAHALGGEVDYHPGGMEIGTVDVQCHAGARDDALFHGLPRQFPAQVIHRQSVRRLPQQGVLLAGSDFEPHQAFRVGDSAWGVQFHPEFSREVMAAYVELLAPSLDRDGMDSAALAARVSETDAATSLLGKFAALAQARAKPR